MTRPAFVAVGAILAALVADALGGGEGGLRRATVVLAVAAALAISAVAARHRPTLAATLVGVALIAARVAAGTAFATPQGTLSPGEGAWSGHVASVAAPSRGQQRFELVVDETAVHVDVLSPRYPEVAPGDRVDVKGRLRLPPDDAYGASLRRRGSAGVVDAHEVAMEATVARDAASLPGMLRAAGDAGLRASLPEPEAGLAAGILLGMRERVDRALAADFATTGLSHIVAISGWNIAIVVGALAVGLRRFRRRARTAGTIAAVVAYVAVVGASPPVVRAALMTGIVLVARESGRRAAAASALALAAIAMLLLDPATIADPGFRLSSAATAGLVAWATPLTERLRTAVGRRAPDWAIETLGVSLAAQAATLPIVLLGFGRLSLVSPAANLVVAPVVPVAMGAGGIAMVGGFVATTLGLPPVIGAIIGLPGWVALGAIVAVTSVGAGLPLASVTLGAPWDAVAAGLAAVSLAMLGVPALRGRIRGWARRLRPPRDRMGDCANGVTLRPPGAGGRNRLHPPSAKRPAPSGRVTRALSLILGVAVLVVAAGAARLPAGRPRVTVLDVGQGDAILVEGERGGRLLVDGGPDPELLLRALDDRLPPWDRRIDVVVLTHPHEDHVAGLPLLLGRYAVGRVVEPGMRGPGPGYRAWRSAIEARRIETTGMFTGDSLAIDGIRLRALWPDAGTVPAEPGDGGRAMNDVSIVLLGEVGATRFLLAADAEDDVDPTLVARGLPRVAVYKVSHHGSRTSSSDALLGALAPRVAIVSVGTGNRYGHPSPDTLARLAAHGSRILRTDRDGTVVVTIDGDRTEIRAEGRRSPVRQPSPRPPAPGAAASPPVGTRDRTPERTPTPERDPAAASAPSPTPALPVPIGSLARRAIHLPAPSGDPDRGRPEALLYHRDDGRPRARRRRRTPARPRSRAVAASPRPGGRGDRRVARNADGGTRHRGRPPPRRGCRAPP